MVTLAIDTSETRGSVALLREGQSVATESHTDGSDYSEWLIPAVGRVLNAGHVGMEQIGLFGVATGPGSFTGLRVGLTTVKAWCEVYGTAVVGVSRLEALLVTGEAEGPGIRPPGGLSVAYYDAQRGQVFGAIYRGEEEGLGRIGDEMVIAPEALLELVGREEGAARWITLDPKVITDLAGWSRRTSCGDEMRVCSADLAAAIARIAEERAKAGLLSDPLALDANYVRRSDAEIFWKGPAAHVR